MERQAGAGPVCSMQRRESLATAARGPQLKIKLPNLMERCLDHQGGVVGVFAIQGVASWNMKAR